MADERDIRRGIPKELWQRVKVAAALEGKTIRLWLVEVLMEKLGKK